MRALRWTSAAALVLTYGLIVLGAWVRATGSGLSCPDWPTCYGHWLPLPGDIPADAGYSYVQVMLEWLHRLIAGLILGPLILVIGVLGWRARAVRPRMPLHVAVLIVLLLVQAGLGGLTVLDQNSPWSVAVHLSVALLLFSVLCLVFERAGPASHPADAATRMLSSLVWLIALAAMGSAAMVAKTGASFACTTWPLCNGALIPDLADPQIRLHFTHRLLALGTGLGVLALAIAARVEPGVRPLAWLAAGLVTLEIALGGLLILWQVPLAAALAHQELGVLAFGVLSLTMWRCHWPTSHARTAHGLSRA